MSEETPQRKHQARIQTKFLSGLAAILFLFSALASTTLYYYAKKTIEIESYAKAELVMTAMEANRRYVRDVLRPKMYEVLADDTFVLEAMSSSFVSRAVMDRANLSQQNFSYRRVAINARNPHYEANPLERQMIQLFRENPQLDEWHGIVEHDAQRYFMRFKPEHFDRSCLHCHGNPQDAPDQILELYGNTRGFFREAGTVHGVTSVGVPVDASLLKIKESAIAIFMAGIPLIVFLYAIISVFFNRFIVQNLHNLLEIFRTTLKDEKDLEALGQSQGLDEINELNDAARAMAHHLSENRHKLERYTERLLQSKELLQSVFDGITDPVVLLDSQARIKIVNAEFLKRYGLSFEDVLDRTPEQLTMLQCCPLQHCGDIFTTMPGHPVTREVKVGSGEIFLIYFYPIQSTIGVVDNLVCYVKDITEQKKLETKIQQTEKLVSMGQLAAGIAHEINNPLGVILCHIDLLKDESNLSPEARQDLAVIEKHAGNCRTIIADLLNFAHQQQTVKVLGSINAVIGEVVSMVAHQFGKNGIEIVLRLDERMPPQYLDLDKMKQVILNLLINSSHAIESSGSIIISTGYEQSSNNCRITIEDTGRGIPEDKLDKIFDPFFTTKPPGKGTGLGLSVSYGIIKDHNGEIRAESSPGKNTCFIIHLPISDREP